MYPQMKMNKDEIRTIYKQKRHQLSDLLIEEKSIAIANQSLKLPVWDKTYFHLFLSIKQQKEVDTDLLLHVLQGKDKQVVVSKSDFKTYGLKHYLLTDSTALKVNRFGIPEPQEGLEVPVEKIEVVFVPLLAFDVAGQRIGYGQGFYDRFLKQCSEKTVCIGLSFFKPLEKKLQAEKHDIPLNYVLTPDEVYDFKLTDKH
jgi:5-formyltetrahydrofolate cyclo-ligase